MTVKNKLKLKLIPILLPSTELWVLGGLSPRTKSLICSPNHQELSIIYISENKHVNKGDLLIQLNDNVELSQRNQSLAKIETQKAYINQLLVQLERQNINLKKASNDYERAKALWNGKAITSQALEDAEFDKNTAQVALSESQKSIQKEQQKLKELESDVAYFETLVQKKKLVSPVNGIVLTLDAKVGQNIQPNSALSQLAPDGPWIVVTEVDELFAEKIAIGLKAKIRFQGSKDDITMGTVSYIAPSLRQKSLFSDQAENLEDRRVREVRIELSNKPDALMIGARVESVILLK
jgi:multidrug resistance efflux pump